MSEAALLIVSALIGALTGILTTSWKSRKDLESAYDIDLRKLRIEAYKSLWELLQPLAFYSPPGPVTYGNVKDLSKKLRVWYFETGGLFLSERTREPYFEFQRALTGLSARATDEEKEEAVVDEQIVEIVKALASRLRTTSTVDISTRVGPRLGSSILSRAVRRWSPRRTRAQVTVDRGWRWNPPRKCYFVIVKNLSIRQDIEVREIWLRTDSSAKIVEGERPLPTKLQPNETLRMWINVDEITAMAGDKVATAVTVRLGNGHNLRGRMASDVPLSGNVLMYPTQPPTEP
jgi:hypothetical protein